MEVLFNIIFIAIIVGGGLWLMRLKLRHDREVVECVNCSDKMTRKRFRSNRGCLRCGSDIMRVSGD